MPKKPLTRHIEVGDIISYTFSPSEGEGTSPVWIGTVVERTFYEWVNYNTGKWREGFRLGVLWEHDADGKVFWVAPTEWERANGYALVARAKAGRRR